MNARAKMSAMMTKSLVHRTPRDKVMLYYASLTSTTHFCMLNVIFRIRSVMPRNDVHEVCMFRLIPSLATLDTEQWISSRNYVGDSRRLLLCVFPVPDEEPLPQRGRHLWMFALSLWTKGVQVLHCHLWCFSRCAVTALLLSFSTAVPNLPSQLSVR